MYDFTPCRLYENLTYYFNLFNYIEIYVHVQLQIILFPVSPFGKKHDFMEMKQYK